MSVCQVQYRDFDLCNLTYRSRMHHTPFASRIHLPARKKSAYLSKIFANEKHTRTFCVHLELITWMHYLARIKLLKFAPYSLLWYLAALIYTLPALWIFNHNKFHAWLPRRNSYHTVTGWIGHACQMRAKHRRGMCIAAIHGLNSSDVSLKRYLTENC